MGNRNLDAGHNYGKGIVYLDFSFLTNGASNPVTTSYRGAGADVIASIVYAATGKYTITMKDPYRYIVTKYSDLEDIAVPDGGYASIGNVTNEGNSTLGPTFVVSTFAASGTGTQFTGRRVSVSVALKNSTVGV